MTYFSPCLPTPGQHSSSLFAWKKSNFLRRDLYLSLAKMAWSLRHGNQNNSMFHRLFVCQRADFASGHRSVAPLQQSLVLHHNVDPPLPSEIPSLQMFLDKVLADEALQRLSSKHQAAIRIERISKPTTSLEERTYLSGQQGHTKECSLSYPHPSSCVQLPELRRCAPLRCPRPYQHLPEPQPRKSQCPCCK